eukprot:SAG31_NODE_1622_length_7722_cov_4.332940_7_plen_94_part_00
MHRAPRAPYRLIWAVGPHAGRTYIHVPPAKSVATRPILYLKSGNHNNLRFYYLSVCGTWKAKVTTARATGNKRVARVAKQKTKLVRVMMVRDL